MEGTDTSHFDVYRLEYGYVLAPSLSLLPLKMRHALEAAPLRESMAVDFLRAPVLWERVLEELEAKFYAIVSADEFAQMFVVAASAPPADDGGTTRKPPQR